MDDTSRDCPPGAARKGFVTRLLDLFSSVWFGIVLLILIFIYSSIGSAYPPFRQHRLLELTEFEWFKWWPFQVLMALFSANLLIVTVRRIPLRWVNAGVWMIHVGILILCAGSVYYFGTKIEGDAPVFRRQVAIRVPGQSEPSHLLVRPGNELTTRVNERTYRFQIANIQPEWPILTGDDAGKTAYSVSVMVEAPDRKFIRQLLAGYPQYTEDVLPGQGRAVKVTGKKLVDEFLDLSLEYVPQEYIFVQDTSALYLRPTGSTQWIERRIENLPHYNERISRSEDVWPAPELRQDPIDLAIPAAGPEDPLAEYDVRVTGYLRYAHMQPAWREGGEALNPVAGLRFWDEHQREHDYELMAFNPRRGGEEDSRMEFRWVGSNEELENLVSEAQASLTIEIPSSNMVKKVLVTDTASGNPQAAFQRIEGTDYEYLVRHVVDNLGLEDGRVVSVAMVDIRTPQRTFRRMVADDPRSTRDMAGDGPDGGHTMIDPDPNIIMKYQPARTAPLTVIAGPDPVKTEVLLNMPGRFGRFQAEVGQKLSIGGVPMQITHLYRYAQQVVRPRVIPPHQRDRDARRAFSMVQVSIAKGSWQQRVWLPYQDYALPGVQYHVPGRIAYQPVPLTLDDGRKMELMFSRERYKLPYAVALDDFTLLTHAGGLIGTSSNVRNYISELRFTTADGGWSEIVPMSLNEPANRQGWWFFQSTWDPPSRGSAGMNYTGMGAGNRNGVHVQLAGTIIAVLGMLYAFYVKPIILRRRRLNVYEMQLHRHDASGLGDPGDEAVLNAPQQPVPAGNHNPTRLVSEEV